MLFKPFLPSPYIMKKTLALILLSAGSFFVTSESQAQTFGYANDALRYSRLYPGGTARILGMGGANVAIGGDLSSAYTNPAGLGFYNRSEFSITPSFYNSVNDAYYIPPGADTRFNPSSDYDYKSRFGLSNLGIAFNWNKNNEDRSGLVSSTLAITYQRTNGFHDRFTYEGSNNTSSLVDIFPLFVDNPNIGDLERPSDPLVGAAYDARLIDIFSEEDANGVIQYYYDSYFPYPDENYPFSQREVVRQEGGQSQINVAYGANIGDKLYLGGGLGIASIDYRLKTRYVETVPDQLYRDSPGDAEYYPNNRFILETDRLTTGGGINANLGIIFRPVSAISVGLSYQTPTLYSLTESEEYRITTSFLENTYGLGRERSGTGLSNFDYRLKTPGKVSVGAAAFLQKWGFITADVEYVNYGNARLNDDYAFLKPDNNAIKKDFQSVVNYRLGGEVRYNVLRLRAGFAHMANPYDFSLKLDGGTNIYSAGAGLKFQKYYVDFAISQQQSSRTYMPYKLPEPDTSPKVNIENKLTSAFLTLGYTF